MKSIDDTRTAVALGADAVGLVARMPSGTGPIADELIAEIAATVPPPVATFLLTSETEGGTVVDHVRRTGTSTVQLVHPFTPADHLAIRAALPGVRLVQVLHVEDERVLAEAEAAAGTVDALLLDSGRPSLPVPELGGTGRVHDWDLSAQVVAASPVPVFLAGGLGPANVGAAIDRVRPYGIDLCNGVRTDGRLDPDKLAALVTAIDDADRRRRAGPPGTAGRASTERPS
jgi:phosphoribosylanthranilate isomerase